MPHHHLYSCSLATRAADAAETDVAAVAAAVAAAGVDGHADGYVDEGYHFGHHFPASAVRDIAEDSHKKSAHT